MPLPCLKPRRSSKVCPAPNSSLDVDLVEVRKGRLLRIQHINPRLRNKQVPQSKHGKTQSPPLELHVPRVSFYGNKCIVTDAPTQNSNHVKKAGGGPSPNNNRVPALVSAHNSNVVRCVKSNHFPSNLSKEQKRMLFKMGVRSVSALKNMVLFFFHGVGGSSDIWQTQINYFSSLGFEIVAPDLIGHGMSEVPLKKRAYHFREILADVIAIFDRYCKKKNLVIGHSYGCAFTTVLARERARRVWRLIMISGGGPIPLAPEIGIFAFPLWFVSCIRPCLDQVFEKSAFKKKQKNEMLKRASFNIPSFVLHYIINGQDWPEGDEVYHSWISVPTLLINGRDDTFATLDDAKLMKATIHGSKLEIVDEASHMVMLEAPDKVNKLILDFICSRGSHKLPDVKESAEEGQESPMRTTQACTYSGGVGGGGGGGGKPIHPLYLPQHQHRAQEVGSGTPSRSPSPEIMVNQFDIENYSQSPVMETPEEIPHYTQQPEVDMYAPTIYVEGSPSQDNSIPWQKWSKVQHGSSYDNASYESDESGEEYYYYKDQYGNHHYVSAKEYARQFPHNQTPPGDFRANEIDMEVSTVDIPAFEDISVDQSSPVDGTPTEEDSNSDYNSVNGYPVEVNANYPLDFDNDGSPGYIVPREARYYNPQCEPMEENEVCESPERSREIDDDLPPIFSIPELQFCEECIQNHNTERTTNCEKCIELNMVPPEYRNYQTTSCIRRQSVTLALGRQRSDSLDYLGQEQLIIITCYDETEDEEISISSSVDDTRVGPRRHSKDQQTNQNATRHNQRAGAHESEETVRKKSPTLPTLNEQEEEYSPGGSPVKKGKTHKGELYRSLHDELLAKVNKRNNLNEAGRAPQVDNKGSGANPPLRSAPSSGEGVVSRKNFLESKKLMEEHFSKTAFKMPALPSNSSSPCRDPTNRRPPKPLGPKPQRRNHSSSQLKREQSKETVASSSPSFLQSKRTIHEHFSKIGLGSPMTRPFSSPNLASYSNDINGASPQRERRLSPSSPSALTRKLTKSEENVTPDPEKSDEESSISQRLSITEWTHTHINRVTELSSPENGETPKSEETPKSASAASRSTASGSASPISTSLSVSDWAERHSRTIAASISPTGSPSRARPGPKQNVSPKVSPAKQTIEQDDSESKTSLSLNDWADRHLKLVTTRMSPSSPVSAQSENGLFRSSSGKEIPVVESANPLTLDDWAQRHLQRIAKMSKTVENENGIIDSKLTRSNQVTSEKNNLRPEALGTKPLTLTEWAERHVRKITELHSRSPKALQLKLADSESDEDSSVVRTPEGIAKPIVKPSFSVLNEWAEQHVRRISEQKLVAGMTKEETSVEKEGSGDTKEKQKTTTDISVNSQQEYETLPAHSDLEDTLTGSQIEHTSAVRDGEAPESRENCTNETEEESKTEDKCILDASTSNAPLLIRGTRSYETRISIDRSQNGGQLLEREKATLEGNEKGNLAIGNNANDNEKQKDICVPGQSEITGESSMSYPERSLSMRPIENEGHSLNRVENVLGVIKDESLIGAAKNVNEEKRPGNNRDLLACTSGMPQTTPERKYLLHRSPLNKPPQTEGCHLSRGNRATAAGENSSPTIGNDVNSEDKNTEICRSQNVGELGATQIDQELKSTLETGLSNTPFKASLPALNIDIDVALELCHETVIDSTPLEQLQRPLCQRRGSSSAAQSQLPPVHKQDSNNDNNNNNNNNNNGSNNNNNNNNTGQREAFSDIRVTRPTVDDNSNVVPTTSVSRGSSEGSVDKVQVSDEEQTGSCCQPADTTSVPTDNDNNRILSDSILVTTSDTDTQTLTNVSNVLAYTSTTTTTTSKN